MATPEIKFVPTPEQERILNQSPMLNAFLDRNIMPDDLEQYFVAVQEQSRGLLAGASGVFGAADYKGFLDECTRIYSPTFRQSLPEDARRYMLEQLILLGFEMGDEGRIDLFRVPLACQLTAFSIFEGYHGAIAMMGKKGSDFIGTVLGFGIELKKKAQLGYNQVNSN